MGVGWKSGWMMGNLEHAAPDCRELIFHLPLIVDHFSLAKVMLQTTLPPAETGVNERVLQGVLKRCLQ
jgi:hypothetical protein